MTQDTTPMASSAWTLETLKIVVEAEISALDKVTTSRFVAGDTRASEAQEAIKVGLANAQRALDAAAVLAKDAVGEAKIAHASEHAAQAMALTLSTLELKERLREMNNFRIQLDNERADFVTRDRLQSEIKTLEGVVISAVTTVSAAASLLDTKVSGVGSAVGVIESKVISLAASDGNLTINAKQLDDRVTALATAMTSMQSRFTAYATAFAVAVVVFELFMRYVVK